MAKKEMTNKEILDTVRAATERAYRQSVADIVGFGALSAIAQRSVGKWRELDDLCCKLGIEYQ